LFSQFVFLLIATCFYFTPPVDGEYFAHAYCFAHGFGRLPCSETYIPLFQRVSDPPSSPTKDACDVRRTFDQDTIDVHGERRVWLSVYDAVDGGNP